MYVSERWLNILPFCSTAGRIRRFSWKCCQQTDVRGSQSPRIVVRTASSFPRIFLSPSSKLQLCNVTKQSHSFSCKVCFNKKAFYLMYICHEVRIMQQTFKNIANFVLGFQGLSSCRVSVELQRHGKMTDLKDCTVD